ncbi:MAG TPA: hypothetical protein VKE50_01860 [Thermoanaerobaculia bacterium]|nr:hypothetical protein [Thermoanaerobaculia bacterium]
MRFLRSLLAGACLLGACSVAVGDDLTNGLSFVAITPCRIIDTRLLSGFSGDYGPPSLVAGSVRTFQITGTTTGTLTDCGIPDTAEALSATFTVTGFSGPGDIRAFPAGGGALPKSSVLNYQLENIANTTTVPMGPSGGGHNGIAVRADVHGTDLIVDVDGYYVTKVLAAFVNADGTLARGLHATGSVKLATGQYQITFDRDLSLCFWIGSPGLSTFGGQFGNATISVAGRSVDTSSLFVEMDDTTTHAFKDNAFGLFVTCP